MNVLSVIKGGVGSTLNQIKSSVNPGKVTSEITNSLGIEMPNVSSKLNVKFSDDAFKLPAGMDTYLPAGLSGLTSNLKMPTEIAGIQLPELPDLSSVTSEVDTALTGIGFDTEKLGIRNIDDILKSPDLASLKNVQFETPVDLNNMPDLAHAMDGFDLSGAQSDLDSALSDVPEDIKKHIKGLNLSQFS